MATRKPQKWRTNVSVCIDTTVTEACESRGAALSVRFSRLVQLVAPYRNPHCKGRKSKPADRGSASITRRFVHPSKGHSLMIGPSLMRSR